MLDPIKDVRQRIDFLMQLGDREALLPRERQRRFLQGEGFVAWSGPILADVLRNFVVHNRMLSGGFVIEERLVTLADITCPVLAFVGEYDQIAMPEAVRAITRDDVVAFHRAYFQPARATVTVTGDVEHEAASLPGLGLDGEPGQLLEGVEHLTPSSNEATRCGTVLGVDDGDRGPVALDVHLEVTGQVGDVQQLLARHAQGPIAVTMLAPAAWEVQDPHGGTESAWRRLRTAPRVRGVCGNRRT